MTSANRPVLVRSMNAADLDSVLAIADSLNEAPRWTREAYLNALDSAATVRRLALVSEDPATGEVTGFTVLSMNPPEAELETIAVTSAGHRRGIARQLFGEAGRLLWPRDISVVVLEVRASNVAALGLYSALRFHEVGRRPRYYVDPVEDAILMRLDIGPGRSDPT